MFILCNFKQKKHVICKVYYKLLHMHLQHCWYFVREIHKSYHHKLLHMYKNLCCWNSLHWIHRFFSEMARSTVNACANIYGDQRCRNKIELFLALWDLDFQKKILCETGTKVIKQLKAKYSTELVRNEQLRADVREGFSGFYLNHGQE